MTEGDPSHAGAPTADEARANRSGDRRFSVVVLLLAVFAGLVGWVQLASNKTDPDLFWQLATGRWIAANGAIPHTDVFSWIGIERSLDWVSQEWLFGFGAWHLYRLGSFTALYAASAALIAATVMLVYGLTLQRSRSPILAVVAAVFAIVGLTVHMSPRPQLVTYALLLAVMLLLERDMPLPALALVVLGVNVHGGVWPIYAVVVAYYALPARPQWLLAALAAPLLTPDPMGLYPYPFPSIMPGSASHIAEFMPTAPVDQPQYLVTLVLLLAGTWGRRIKPRDALFAGALVVLSLSALRHMVFLYVLVVPALSPYIAERLGLFSPARSANRAAGSRRVDLAIALVLAVGIVVMAAQALTTRVDHSRGYPEAALVWLEDHPAQRVLNLWDDGGYMIFRGTKPFIDGRGDPFYGRLNGEIEIVEPYLDAMSLKSDPSAFIQRFEFDYAVLPDTLPISRALKMSGERPVVFAEDGYSVFDLRSAH